MAPLQGVARGEARKVLAQLGIGQVRGNRYLSQLPASCPTRDDRCSVNGLPFPSPLSCNPSSFWKRNSFTHQVTRRNSIHS